MNPLASAGALILHVIFGGYILILLLRFILQKLHANWHNPLSQFVIKLTEKPLQPFRKIIPGIKGYDLSIFVLALLLQCIETILLILLQSNVFPAIAGLVIFSLGKLLSKFVYIYIYAIIINAIASWLPNLQAQPIIHLVSQIAQPLLAPVRRFIPLIAGIDLSPMIALLGLMLINMLVITTILGMGMQLM